MKHTTNIIGFGEYAAIVTHFLQNEGTKFEKTFAKEAEKNLHPKSERLKNIMNKNCSTNSAVSDLVEKFSKNVDLQIMLIDAIYSEMNSDEEAFEKKAVHLLRAYAENPEIVDNILMSLCGWTMEGLMKKVEIK